MTAVSDQATLDAFAEKMDDDFNTPTATAVVFAAMRRANGLLAAGDRSAADPVAAAVLELFGMLGVAPDASEAEIDAGAAAMAAERDEARRAKNWARADALRDRLTALGWTVEDAPEGTRLSR